MNVKEIDYKDRSEFLRGFSVIIRKNNCGNLDEKTMFLTIGKYFGFEKEFCKESLKRLMVNKYISEKPAVFSTKHVAKFFVNDVAKEWLQKTAEANKVDFVLC